MKFPQNKDDSPKTLFVSFFVKEFQDMFIGE